MEKRMKVLVTGGNGQLGTEVTKLLEEKNVEHVSFDSEELDILDKEKVHELFTKEQPTVIFHCAAYTAVDNAEDVGKEANWKVNVEGTRHVAESAKEVGAMVVYISTDYVFDGKVEEEYTEESETNPKNEYGKAKLAGEKVIQDVLDNYYIVRTSWVFGAFGSNFVYTMQRLAKECETLTIVNDQLGRPTWTRTLAEFMLHLIETNPEKGLYHLSNEGQCTWYEFAKEILKNEEVSVQPVTSEEFPQKAYRPKHSVMSLKKAKATGFDIPTWKEALKSFLA